ncbi:MAG TPA: translation initiation factor IF-1 [Candidatus Paceibacterota bacterium]
MAHQEKEKVTGTVIEALPNAMFRVVLAGAPGESSPVLAFLSGKMRLNRIRVLVGDKVEIEKDEYGGKGRIVKRL